MPNPHNPFRKAVMGTNEFEEVVIDIEITLALFQKHSNFKLSDF